MSDQADQLRHEIAKEDEEIKEEDVHDHVVLVTDSDGQVKVQGEEEGKKESFLQKLHRSDSSSAGSSGDEEAEGEKNKKKKKRDIKEKIVIDDEGRKEEVEDTEVVVEKVEAIRVEQSAVAPEEEEKKGFLEKIKEKLPSNLGKIMEKLPGYHKADQEKEGAKKN
ncbi:dehydrin COR410-like [Zingiber officinale]|uniref:dehydrin COR410-like n=1 Tax=Zingiber officinale TaxID=94328 RepID=UPI001C4D4AE2|nr:dehydrin COR410-like [Zingiber officinale]